MAENSNVEDKKDKPSLDQSSGSKEMETEKIIATLEETIASLEKALEEKKKRINELENDLKWNRADFENFRKSTEKRLDTEKQNINARIIKEFLPFFDSFDKAMEMLPTLEANVEDPKTTTKFINGFKGLYKNLNGILKGKKLDRMQTVGKAFDYNMHEVAMRVVDESKDEDTIVHEIQPGWLLDGKVLRPAMVAVSSKPEPPKPEPSPKEEENGPAGADTSIREEEKEE